MYVEKKKRDKRFLFDWKASKHIFTESGFLQASPTTF